MESITAWTEILSRIFRWFPQNQRHCIHSHQNQFYRIYIDRKICKICTVSHHIPLFWVSRFPAAIFLSPEINKNAIYFYEFLYEMSFLWFASRLVHDTRAQCTRDILIHIYSNKLWIFNLPATIRFEYRSCEFYSSS